ncbi:MAG: insulinase family protein [Actinomycetales bacterium]|nr:insulinase family protein [Actinomycetales bacterium]
MTEALPTMIGETCGVRTLHIDKQGLTKASLYVGAGWADETFATRGVTHAIEHLIMNGTTRGTFEANATVVMHRTAFWAIGRPEQVGTFLNEVAAGIRSLPLDRLSHEAKVLRAEAGGPGYGPHDAMLKCRYGHEGPGLAMFWGSGPLATDEQVVADHARRWFVRDNAVLTVVGPMPDGLDLTLPDGDVPSRTFADISRPGVVSFDVADPVLSFVMPEGPVVGVLAGAMARRLEEELRHAQGHVYGIVPEVMRLPGAGSVVVQLAAQISPGSAKEVAEAMARELAYRAEVGLSEQERDEMLELWDLAADDGDELADLEHNAERLLCGLAPRSFADARPVILAVDLTTVAAEVREAAAGALLLVPRGVEVDTPLPDGLSCTTSRAMTTTPLRRRLRSKAPKGAALGYDDDVVEYRDEDGDVHTIRIDEIVGVGVDGRTREIVGRRGCFITLDPRDFAGVDAIVRATDERVPAGLHFDLRAWFGAD